MAKANRQGRIGTGVANLFSGLLRNARDGSTYYIACRSKNGVKTRILINNSSVQNKARAVTFPYDIFEVAITVFLKRDPPNIKVKALLELLEATEDKAPVRLQLRALLRRVLRSVYLLVVPSGRNRLASVQLCFAGGHCSNYLILYQPMPSGPISAAITPPKPKQTSSWAWLIRNNAPDLRSRYAIAKEERRLQGINVKELLLAQRELEKYDGKYNPHANLSSAEWKRVRRAWDVLQAARLR